MGWRGHFSSQITNNKGMPLTQGMSIREFRNDSSHSGFFFLFWSLSGSRFKFLMLALCLLFESCDVFLPWIVACMTIVLDPVHPVSFDLSLPSCRFLHQIVNVLFLEWILSLDSMMNSIYLWLSWWIVLRMTHMLFSLMACSLSDMQYRLPASRILFSVILGMFDCYFSHTSCTGNTITLFSDDQSTGHASFLTGTAPLPCLIATQK